MYGMQSKYDANSLEMKIARENDVNDFMEVVLA